MNSSYWEVTPKQSEDPHQDLIEWAAEYHEEADKYSDNPDYMGDLYYCVLNPNSY